jgi:hypothetical protein
LNGITFREDSDSTANRMESNLNALSVVRFTGNDEETALKLRQATLSHFVKNCPEEQRHSSSVINIDNKYFRVSVALEPSLSTTNRKDDKEEGMILAFDATDFTESCNSFDKLSSIHLDAENRGECGDLLRMCVAITDFEGNTYASGGTHDANSKKQEEEYSRRVLWCLDHGYEYVEADITLKEQNEGHSLRDKDGFARIVEAIGSTVWSTATMHPRSSKLKVSAETLKPPEESSSIRTDNSETSPMTGSNAIAASALDCAIPSQHGCGANEEGERMDHFESLISEATRVRDAATSGAVSDEERRKNASDMALRLMGMMDTFGLDHEDSCSEDDSQ